MKYYVPKDTQTVLTRYIEQCHNLRLILSRYLSEETVSNANVEGERNQKWRDKWLKETLKRLPNDKFSGLVEAEFNRWLEMTTGADQFPLVNITRMVVGLGSKGALEFGITLHHLTGLPFIPGSALKGLTRSYALLSLAEQEGVANAAEELKQFDAKLVQGRHDEEPAALYYRKAFGSQKEAGVCQFFDGVLMALNKESAIFELDVMTPHFVKYYSEKGKTAPHDADSPNPIPFVTVGAEHEWAFAIGLRHGNSDESAQKTRLQAKKWLRRALMEMGIGSKTSNGYGFFAPPPKS